jgi:type III pantothenate kinase
MTCLLVDLGNSRCKFAITSADGFRAVVAIDYDDRVALKDYLESHARPGMAALASQVVADRKAAQILDAVASATGRLAHAVRANDSLPGVRNGYRKPNQLGVDRLLAMVAARAHRKGSLCVVDVGTAVTIDMIDAAGEHLGGLILPGEQLARDSLLNSTDIPHDSEIRQEVSLGRDTATAIALGARYAAASVVATVVEHYQRRLHAEVRVIVGGGGSDAVFPLLPAGAERLPELVLHGLALVAAKEGL